MGIHNRSLAYIGAQVLRRLADFFDVFVERNGGHGGRVVVSCGAAGTHGPGLGGVLQLGLGVGG
jgi:hypothetical protein